MPILTLEDIRKIAFLGRLELSEEEVSQFAGQLASILDHFTELQSVDTSDVPATLHSVGGRNVTRPDAARPSLPPSEVVAGAPEAEDNMFVVPQIVET